MCKRGDGLLTDAEIASERSVVRLALSRIRPHFPPGVLVEVAEERIRLDLPTSSVDAWRLFDLAVSSTSPSLKTVDVAELLHLLDPGSFLGLNTNLAPVEALARRITEAQQSLVLRLASDFPDRFPGALIETVHRHLADDPFSENLLLVLVVATAQAGNRPAALNRLRQAREEFAQSGLDLSARFHDLERELLQGTVGPYFIPLVDPARLKLPALLRSVRVGSHVGHEQQLAALTALVDADDYGAAVVEGPHGAGKTRLWCQPCPTKCSTSAWWCRSSAGGSILAPYRSSPVSRWTR